MFSHFLSRAFNRSVTAPVHGPVTTANTGSHSVAHQLFESADSGAGRDPYRAQELRDAARAFLSVVR